MKQVILFLSIFIIVFLIYYIFVVRRKKTLEKYKNGKELTYLKYRYKLKIEKLNLKQLATILSLSNAFIIALVVTIISMFKSFLLQMLIGLVTLIPTILIVYHIIGKYYQKQGRIK